MNKYKIDYNTNYDRLEKPFGVYVKSSAFSRWKYICNFKSNMEAENYIKNLLDLPREIYKRN